MNFLKTFLESIESLASNKLRSSLTVLGIVIGVGAVIAMMALGDGAQSSILGEIEGIGANLIFVFQNSSDDIQNPKPMTEADANALEDPFQAPHIKGVAYVLQGSGEATYSGESKSVTVMGTSSQYFTLRNVVLTEGSPFDDTQILARSAVAIIGVNVANDLLGRTNNVVDETIRIEGQPFKVIGLLEEKGTNGPMAPSEDDQIIIPISTARARLISRPTPDWVDIVYVSAVDSDSVDNAQNEISEILRSRHRITTEGEDFQIFTQQDVIGIASSILGVLTIFLTGIATISLLVGGIGIMNIMLVSVIERTREIGLRKALGARKNDIVMQFITESAVLSLVGGILGIGLGWSISFIVGLIAKANNANLDPVIGFKAISIATGVSAFVGILAGLYPAIRAANLQPVEALRYE